MSAQSLHADTQPTFGRAVCCAEVLFQPSFLFNTLLLEIETINTLVVVLVGGRRTLRIKERDLAQTERTHETC